jgi:outer membrane lipoprotein-sorting protein
VRAARALLALVGAAHLASGPAAAGAEDLTLETFMHKVSSAPGVVARFRETKQLALLREPLESEGRLYFAPPDRLAREIVRPAPSSIVIVGGSLWMRDAGGVERVDLAGSEAARQFVDNFLVLFNGDLERLRERYDVQFRARGVQWTLVLQPRVRPLKFVIERIEMSGEGAALHRMVTTEVEGDVTSTVFEDVDTEHSFTVEELDRHFGRGDG